MPIDWDPEGEYTLDEVYDEVDRQRIALGLKPLKEKEVEESSEYISKEHGDYNKSIYVGLDLGKKADHTALIFLEPFIPKGAEKKKFTYHITKTKRYNLGTPYPVIARTLKKIDDQFREKLSEEKEFVYYVIDEGGVGAAVTDQVIELIPNADIYRVTLTGGIRAIWHKARNLSLPKPQMASTLIALFEADRIWIPGQEKEVEIFRKELLDYELSVTKAGHDQFGAMKMGTHDDIISALGIAAWVAEDANGGAVPAMW